MSIVFMLGKFLWRETRAGFFFVDSSPTPLQLFYKVYLTAT
jgi:hypothetical protein